MSTRPSLVSDIVEHRRHARFAADIGPQVPRDHRLRRRNQIGNHHPGPGHGQPGGDGRADTACPAGDQRRLVLEIHDPPDLRGSLGQARAKENRPGREDARADRKPRSGLDQKLRTVVSSAMIAPAMASGLAAVTPSMSAEASSPLPGR